QAACGNENAKAQMEGDDRPQAGALHRSVSARTRQRRGDPTSLERPGEIRCCATPKEPREVEMRAHPGEIVAPGSGCVAQAEHGRIGEVLGEIYAAKNWDEVSPAKRRGDHGAAPIEVF